MFTTEFLVTSLIVALIRRGTGVVFNVSTGLAQRRRVSLFAGLGCTLGKWKGVVICFGKQITTL